MSEIVSLPRALSKLGYCSRSQAERYIREGKVCVNGRIVRDSAQRVRLGVDKLCVGGEEVQRERLIYVMLNKPRGLVTTAADERGRDTVFKCFEGVQLPRLFPVGRLDQASEGLLLFSNDTQWAEAMTSPRTHVPKRYHVQVSPIPDEGVFARCRTGVESNGELLRCAGISLLRHGQRNAWLEIVLLEGRNRHIRRMLAAVDLEVIRLVRVAIGTLELGDLAKGSFRELTPPEVRNLCRVD